MGKVSEISKTFAKTFVSLEHEDQEALTPNHFLVGSLNGRRPVGIIGTYEANSRIQRKLVQELSQHFGGAG